MTIVWLYIQGIRYPWKVLDTFYHKMQNQFLSETFFRFGWFLLVLELCCHKMLQSRWIILYNIMHDTQELLYFYHCLAKPLPSQVRPLQPFLHSHEKDSDDVWEQFPSFLQGFVPQMSITEENISTKKRDQDSITEEINARKIGTKA